MKYQVMQSKSSEVWASLMPNGEDIANSLHTYDLVATIEADNLDQVFEIGNIGPKSKIEQRLPMRSISVSDVIVDENSDYYFVDIVGFKKLSLPSKIKTHSEFEAWVKLAQGE